MGFKVLTSLKSCVSLFWRWWLSPPSQNLQSIDPPDCKICGARSKTEKQRRINFWWSSSRIPVALGAMSLRITSTFPLGSNSRIFWWVAGSEMSEWGKKSAPSRAAIWRRSTPRTKPTGASGSSRQKIKNKKVNIRNQASPKPQKGWILAQWQSTL